MSQLIWQLPVNQSNLNDHDWIHTSAKYHAFLNNKSICRKYQQNTNSFETSIEESELMSKKQYACKKCLKVLNIEI